MKSFIKVAREKGTIVNTHTIIATARGVVISHMHDANLPFENGGYIKITKSWSQQLLERMNLVKRKGTTAVKVLPCNFEKLKKQFLSDVCSTVIMEDIPEELIINWDQTGLKYVPVSNWTFADNGLGSGHTDTDRQTQTDRETDRQTDRQTDRHRQTDRQTDTQAYRRVNQSNFKKPGMRGLWPCVPGLKFKINQLLTTCS